MAYVLSNFPSFLMLIGPLIFFHELGHFLVAKWTGVRVLRFSLGFGPKLLSFRRGETEYVIAAIPLGGYVKMWGDDPTIELSPAEQKGSFLHLSLPKRAAIVIAGPAFNLILAAVAYAGLYAAGMPDNAPTLGFVISGGPAASAGINAGDTIVAIDGQPMRYFSDVQKRIEKNTGTAMKIDLKSPSGEQRQVVVTPSVSEERDELRQKVMRGRVGISPYAVAPLVDVVDLQSPAAKAGVQLGDEITQIDGAPVTTWREVVLKLRSNTEANATIVVKRKEGDTEVSKSLTLARVKAETPREDAHLRPDPDGLYSGLLSYDTRISEILPDSPAAKLGFQVGDRLVAFEGKPITAWAFDLAAWNGLAPNKDMHITYARGDELKDAVLRFNDDESLQFGARNGAGSLRGSPVTHTFGAAEAVWGGIVRTYDASRTTLLGVAYLISGRLARTEVGSVIMLFVVAEKAVAHGASAFFELMAVVSVSLGVMNLLPVPVLDGGHLVFIGAEAIRRKPLSLRAREYAAMAGLVILLLLMAFAFFNDINKFVLR